MKIAECQTLLSTSLSCTRIPATENTPLRRDAATVLRMSRAYESDGRTFFASGDLVNALASYWYGFGWLHFGISYGLLASPENPACPNLGSCESIPPRLREKLAEKTGRYAHLLDTARCSVECAPDPATYSHDFSERVLFIAAIYAVQGRDYMKSGAMEDALACFSYGHGWLDAGVTCGLFRIVAERDLFCV